MKQLFLILFAILLLNGCGECENSIEGGIKNNGITSQGLLEIVLDILLVDSGQSNSDGIQSYKFQYTELSNTYFFLDGYWYEDYPYETTGFEASLINSVAKANPNKKIGIVKFAKGSTAIKKWESGIADGLYETLIGNITLAMSTSNKDFVDGFFFMQGESDSLYKSTSLQYADALIAFIENIRNDIGYTSIYLGLISPENPRMKYVENVRNAQVKTSSNSEDVYITDTYDLEKCCDNIHFNIESQKILGDRFADIFNISNVL